MLPLTFIFASLIAFSSVNNVNAQSPVKCSSFWPGVTAGANSTIDALCYIYPWSPEIIGTVNVILAYDEIWRNDAMSLSSLDHLEGIIQQALLDTIPRYESLQANIADVVVILGNENHNPTAAADTIRPLSTTGACQIRLFYGWFGHDANDDFRLQVIAHEMYHCVQQAMFGNSPSPSPWWNEGSASYFSNVVYPRLNNEWPAARTYQPDIALYANDAYSTEIFFQSMEQSKGIVGIQNWIQNQVPQLADQAAEKTRLSAFPGFVDDFHLFAQQFSLRKIRDSDGNDLVPIDNSVMPHPVTLTSGVPLADSTVGITTLSAPPFTVQVFVFSLDGGQTVTISYSSTQSNVLMSYKQDGDTVWTTLPNAPVSSAQGTIVVPCNDGNAVAIMMLFTSTDDVDVAEADIIVTQVSKDDTCECKQPGAKKRGLNSCPKSSPSVSVAPDTSAISSAKPTLALSSDSVPCFSGPAVSYSTNCVYGVSCFPTSDTSIFSQIIVLSSSALCGSSLTACETTSLSYAENLGYLTMYQVHCSVSKVASVTAASATVTATTSFN